jgi:hypothetical protein
MSDEKPADRDARLYDGIEEEEVIDEEADGAQSDLPGDLEGGGAAPDAELEDRLQDALAEKRRRRAAARDRRARRRGAADG